ncbi:MAG: AI-2E family transporter [Oscillospiraceae bacterium]
MRSTGNRYRLFIIGGILAAVLLSVRYLLPLALPFLVGLAVAWMAEPLAKFLSRRAKFPRGLAAGTAIGEYTCCFWVFCTCWGGWPCRRWTTWPPDSRGLWTVWTRPQTGSRAGCTTWPKARRSGCGRGWRRASPSCSPMAPPWQKAPSPGSWATSQIIVTLPDTFVFLGTAVVSSFMISAQLPRLRPFLQGKLPPAWSQRVLPVLQNLRVNLGGWFRAQCKLMGLTFLLLTIGFLILRVEFPLLLGALIALVDALPMLGTGTVLVPWGLLVLLQGQTALGLGLIALYGVTALTRSILEPRMVGRQLGLNPLLTLVALYIGYRLWGILGMILAPVLTITILEIWSMAQPERGN